MDKSVSTKHWFELDLNWIKTDFKTGGCIINMLFRRHISGQSDANAPILSIVIGSYKKPTLEEIHSHKKPLNINKVTMDVFASSVYHI